jgi:type IV pilus assembly protein PilV
LIFTSSTTAVMLASAKKSRLTGLKRKQLGFGLIETLIAGLLLSIGIYAMLALQSSALREGKTSQYRLAASQSINDLANRLRANVSAAQVGAYTINIYQNITSVNVTQMCSGAGAICTPQQMAVFDLKQWGNQAAQSLPSPGWLSTSTPSTGLTHIDIWLAWQEPIDRKTQAIRSPCPASIPANLQCIYMKVVL